MKNFLFNNNFREIEVESDDEALYQSKRSSQMKREQHSSLPDLTETLANSNTTFNNINSNHMQQSIQSPTDLSSTKSPNESNSKSKSKKKVFSKKNITIIYGLF